MELPRGFTAIKDVVNAGESVSVIGVLIQYKEPYRSRGDDWVLDFSIQDEFASSSASVGVKSGFRCRVFRREKSRLPSNQSVGDMVLVRDISTSRYNNSIEGVSSARHQAAILFFPAAGIPNPGLSTGYGLGGQQRLSFCSTWGAKEPSAIEQLAIINLKAESTKFTKIIQQHANKVWNAPSRIDKRALIQDVLVGNYYNLITEVVKSYSAGFGNLDLYVTDYTVNSDLFLYDDPMFAQEDGFRSSSQWKGPPGQITMQIRLWDPHASYAQENIREGDFISLTDVHIKLSQANKLEGALHQDQRYHDKIKVRKLTYAHQYEELEKRKEDYLYNYELKQAKQHIAAKDANVAKKASARSARKKEEKKEKERQKLRELEKKIKEQEVARAGINRHVVAAHPTVELSTVDEILNNSARTIKDPKSGTLELPFINAKHRTRLRVVDFTPQNLEDFTRSMQDPDWNTNLEEPSIKDRRRDDRWQWAFILCVEDANIRAGAAPLRFPLFVNDDAGQYLLSMSASDLRNDPQGQALKKLEEKLFILWGNLLEIKKELMPKGVQFPLCSGDERLQNLPFECCVEEYGFKLPEPTVRWPKGYQRMHRLMGTVIRGDD